jgi:hypothetical protein
MRQHTTRRNVLAGLAALAVPFLAASRGRAQVVMRLSEFEGVDFWAKWTAALAVARQRGGGEIVIDQNVSLTRPLQLQNGEGRNLKIRGAQAAIVVEAAASMPRLLHCLAEGNEGFSIEDITFRGNGQIASTLVEVESNGFRASGLDFDGGLKAGHLTGFGLRGGAAVIENCRFANMPSGLRLKPRGALVRAVQINSCNFVRLSRRGLSIIGGDHVLSDVEVRNCHFDDLEGSCQPVRVDGATGKIRDVRLFDGTVLGKGSGPGADDCVSFNGDVQNFSIMGWNINRTSDVGVNASNGTRHGKIANNRIAGCDYGVNVGAAADFPGRLNRDILIEANQMTNCNWGFVRAFSSRRISVIGNTGVVQGAAKPVGIEYRASNQLVARGNIWRGVSREYLDKDAANQVSSFLEVEGKFDFMPKMENGAPKEKSLITLPGGRKMKWNGKVFTAKQ